MLVWDGGKRRQERVKNYGAWVCTDEDRSSICMWRVHEVFLSLGCRGGRGSRGCVPGPVSCHWLVGRIRRDRDLTNRSSSKQPSTIAI